jgi:hypothetical protein
MRFDVPQFIEVEDKIIGPLTLKQFLFLLAGGAVLFLLWFYLPLYLFILIGLPVLVLALALAFYKVNGRPLIKYLLSMIKYHSKPKTYLWKKK